ncbi:MAG: hypothetical protein FWE37_05775 [Spirochaetaceae bacterium]|nr:hypothetical protein [Spirochaetaceae bacterium]
MNNPIAAEHALKNKVYDDFFNHKDVTWTQELDKIDFIVFNQKTGQHLLYAEAKLAASEESLMFTQLMLTLKKSHDRGDENLPNYLACFDSHKISFVSFHTLLPIFNESSFDWSVTPSNHKHPNFAQNKAIVAKYLAGNSISYTFNGFEDELRLFIKQNIIANTTQTTKAIITRNNFTRIYEKWRKVVSPSIRVDWLLAKKSGLIDGDFYLADLLSNNNLSLYTDLFVSLQGNKYEFDRNIDEVGTYVTRSATFRDEGAAHAQFWAKYQRPPKEEWHSYIRGRRDLLVPQDIRERKGSFFTPQIWVKKSQEYLSEVLGEDWQSEYTVWDCACGTGNLLVGLTEPYNIYASTLDKADVAEIKQSIKEGKTPNLKEAHIFQFDFLNDDFKAVSEGGKVPDGLMAILNDPEKRKKLLIYINPPYAEAGNMKTVVGTGENKDGVSTENHVYNKYKNSIKQAANEVFALFLARIYDEIEGCAIGIFSKLKIFQAPNFATFRQFFQATLPSLFIVPSNTFDNVKGNFPIGFHIWDTKIKKIFKKVTATVYNAAGEELVLKNIYSYDDQKVISKWLTSLKDKNNTPIGVIKADSNDFQHQRGVYIQNMLESKAHAFTFSITLTTFIPAVVYLAVRHCIQADWLNDRDLFLWPYDTWQNDTQFHNNCLAYTLFSSFNTIKSEDGINHWLPFTESGVNAATKFQSNFITNFIQGKLAQTTTGGELGEELAAKSFVPSIPLQFSAQATAVFNAGRQLWAYYHTEAYKKDKNTNVNASFYDIRSYFCGFNEEGKKRRMNVTSSDDTYNGLVKTLREAHKLLGEVIAPKVWEYGFLR